MLHYVLTVNAKVSYNLHLIKHLPNYNFGLIVFYQFVCVLIAFVLAFSCYKLLPWNAEYSFNFF